MWFFFLMTRRPPRSTRTDTLFPYTTLFRSNFRNVQPFDEWMKANDRIGLAGVDTRALTRRIRLSGAPNAAIAHDPEGNFDIDALLTKAQSWPGLEGIDRKSTRLNSSH